jgi:probable DNA repair protein
MPVDTNYNFYPIDALTEHLSANRPILTPNHRLARRIKLAWGRHNVAQGRAAWHTPTVMSLEHWWLACYRERVSQGDEMPSLLTTSQEQALWLSCVESSVELALLRPGAAAELAADAYRNLHLWDIDWCAEIQQFSFGEDTRLFPAWAAEFEKNLAQLGRALLPSLVPQLAAACPRDSLVLAEFDELPPLYLRALERQAGQITRYQQGRQQADCSLQPCDSHRGELEAAARWARECHRENPQQRIGILLPRLQSERREIERILHREFDSDPRNPASLPVNFSAGIPLADCGPVRAALALLQLPARDTGLADLAQVLHSRYRDQSELPREELAWENLARDAIDPVEPGLLRHALDRVSANTDASSRLGQVLLQAGQLREVRVARPTAEWPERFLALLGEFGWPGPGPLDSLEYQQVEEFHTALHGIGELEPLQAKMNYAGALSALEQVCAGSVFQAQTPDAPIQILGVLEAAGLQFDALWICCMAATEWPPAPSPNPFIPRQLQRAAGLPHADAGRELEYAARLLTHLRSSTVSLVASYARLEEEIAVPPSALVADMRIAEPLADRRWPDHWRQVAQSVELESFSIGEAPPVGSDEARLLRGGSSILRDQSQCPFRAFAKYRLDAVPLPAAQAGLGAAERGSILHEALFHLWGELDNSERLQGLDPAGRQELIDRSAETAIGSFRRGPGRRLGTALLALEQRRLAKLLLRWLEVESERAGFVVSAREQRHEICFGDLAITLRVDRVDSLPGGRHLLIDYKTGDAKTSLWLGERPEDPQIPLYAQVLDAGEVEGVSFAVLRHAQTEYRGLARSEQGPGIGADVAGVSAKSDVPVLDWEALQIHWRRVLESLAQEFLDGHAPVQPLYPARTCNYCGLEALCRVR